MSRLRQQDELNNSRITPKQRSIDDILCCFLFQEDIIFYKVLTKIDKRCIMILLFNYLIKETRKVNEEL